MAGKIETRQDSDGLVFYEGVGTGRITSSHPLLRISPTEIKVGTTTSDIDLKVFLGSGTKHVLFDAGNSKVTMTGVPLEGTYTSIATAQSALKFTDSYTIVDGYHVGAWFNSTASFAGARTATVYALRGHAATSGVQTNVATAHYVIGTHGRISLAGTINADNLIAAGVAGQILQGSGTLTKLSHVAAGWFDSQLNDTVSSGEAELLYLSNNGSTLLGQAIFLHGNDKITYFLKTDTLLNCVTSVGTGDITTSGVIKKIKCHIEGDELYLLAVASVSAA